MVEQKEGFKPKGPIFAIVTPFIKDEIDYDFLQKYLAFLEKKEVRTIVTNGTTAEFASLTKEERKELVEFCRKNFNGEIINHIGTSSLKETTDLMVHSENYCDALLCLPPYYFANVTEEGIYQYYREILSRTDMPFFMYHFPRHTQITFSPNVITKLKSEHPHLVGIKDSSGDLTLSSAFSETGIDVFTGKDSAALKVLQKGMKGNVSGAGNPVPEFLIQLSDAYSKKDFKKAEKVQENFDRWNHFRKTIDKSEVAVVKAGLASRISGFPLEVRSPFIACTETEKEHIQAKLMEEILPFV